MNFESIDLSALEKLLSKEVTEKESMDGLTEVGGTAMAYLMKSDSRAMHEILPWTEHLTARLKFEYVYVFKGTHNGVARYKIGKAKNIKDRRSIFSVKLPFDIDLVAAFRVKNAIQTESAIHKAQAANRVGGEWFDLDEIAFDAVFRQGVSVELADLADAMQESLGLDIPGQVMNDAEYISYLECLLAMQGVKFSRSKGISK